MSTVCIDGHKGSNKREKYLQIDAKSKRLEGEISESLTPLLPVCLYVCMWCVCTTAVCVCVCGSQQKTNFRKRM